MKKLLIIGLLTAPISNFAIAAEQTSDYIGLAYSALDMDDIEGDFTGYKLDGKYEITEQFYLSGKYQDDKADGRNEIFSNLNLGISGSASDSMSWFLEGGYAQVELQRFSSGDFTSSGFHAATGLTTSISDQFDATVRIDFTDAGKVDNAFGDYSETEFSLVLDYRFSENVSIFSDYSKGQSQSSYSFGAKFYF